MTNIMIGLLVGLAVGCVLGFVLYSFYRSSVRKSAQAEANDIIDHAKDAAEIVSMDLKEKQIELEEELWGKVESEMLKAEERAEELTELLEEKKKKIEETQRRRQSELAKEENSLRAQEKNVEQKQHALDNRKAETLKLNKAYSEKLADKLQCKPQDVTTQIMDELLREAQTRGAKMINFLEDDAKETATQKATRLLDIALDRFQRPYCSERGIAPVEIPDERIRKILSNPQDPVTKAIVDACGCDIIVESEMTHVGIAGFDPVRREHTRRTLESLFKQKNLDAQAVNRIAQNIKREMFKKIKNDGDQIAKELKQEDLHPEIKQMMGSLRYRYSFTQNQYFHCGEVGWLCGLLAIELGGVNVKKARRSGLLHDLGKSMDHAMDGGHAVIGADFIQKRNEAADVVHAVRAHHFDEQPSTDMAYLVIAADAISGARPGARRSTIESYTQKVTELEGIAKSFDGVDDCYILSGGREVRVITDSKKVDDNRALHLSHDIAKRIESELNYPGHIKVVVVRRTIASEMTQGR